MLTSRDLSLGPQCFFQHRSLHCQRLERTILQAQGPLSETLVALTLPCSARTRSTITGSQRLCDDICRVILSLVQHRARLCSVHMSNDPTSAIVADPNSARPAYPFGDSTRSSLRF